MRTHRRILGGIVFIAAAGSMAIACGGKQELDPRLAGVWEYRTASTQASLDVAPDGH